jgi:peptide/nickel transport system ATP-binding protein
MGSIPAIGGPQGRLTQIEGNMPRLTEIPPGCAYNPRCPRAGQRCLEQRPELMPAGSTLAACWLYDAAGTGPALARGKPAEMANA